MESTLKSDVLIVGAGPTGLMAANQLAHFGISFIIIDKKEGPTKESRAIVVSARSLELYQQMGLDHQVVNGGKKITSFNVYSDGKRKARVNLGEIGAGMSQFSYVVAFEQSKNEELLTNTLIDGGQRVHWKTELLNLIEHQHTIRAEVQSDGKRNVIDAQYLIACDGANSTVRQQLQFHFRGGTYDHKFFVADTHVNWDQDYHQLIISPGDENFCGFLPLYGDKSYRVLGTLPKKYIDKENIGFEDIRKVVMRTIGVPLEFTSVNWFSVYKLHHRCVDHFTQGRAFLAGDSAHIHSPAGGQGMNTGLQDAYNLCWKLALVIKGQAHESLLATYNEERLPFAKWLVNFTDQGFSMMTNQNPVIKVLRKYIGLNFISLLLASSWIRPRAFKILSQIWYSYKGKSLSLSHTRQPLTFHAGDRVPYIANENVHLLLRDASFHMLHLGDELSQERKIQMESFFPFAVKCVGTPITDGWRKLGVTNELFMLVRPDNYIGMVADEMDEQVAKKYLRGRF